MPKFPLNPSLLAGLKYGEFASLGVVDLSSLALSDVLVELAITPGQSDGQRQVFIYARVSLDGTAWSTGPHEGTATGDLVNLYQIDPLPLNTPGQLQRRAFSLARRIGFAPPFVEIIVRNESGAALPQEGHAAALYAVER